MNGPTPNPSQEGSKTVSAQRQFPSGEGSGVGSGCRCALLESWKLAMNAVAKILAPLALAATILPAVLFLFKVLGEGPMKATMLVAAILWFATAPFWLKGGGK